MYKVNNPYKESSIFELNMMQVHEQRKFKFSSVEMFTLAFPFMMVAIILFATFVPNMEFFAECQNIPGGDICSIRLR